MYRQILCIVCLTTALGCRPRAGDTPVAVVDLLRELDDAEKRPAADFTLAAHEEHGIVRAAIVVPVPSRLTIPLPVPRRGVLRAFAALDAGNPATAARFRVGVSDHRIYEGLNEVTVTGERRGWVELRADLSAYAGFKWSLFYRPDRIVWRLVLATDAVSAIPVRAVWGTPEVMADRESAKEYIARRERMAR
jgi:hypothetical protein